MAQLEHEIQCKLPPGHPVLYSSAVHASCLYNRYHNHSTIKVTPFQAVHGRPYRGRITCFGQKVFGLMARGNKKPMWKQRVWFSRDEADQDVIATTPQTITKTRSVRKTAHEWVAEDILAIEIGPWNTSSRLESKLHVQPLRGLLPRHIPDADRDLDAETVQASPIQLLRQSLRKARELATKANLTAHHHLAVKAGGKNKVRLTFLKNKVGKSSCRHNGL